MLQYEKKHNLDIYHQSKLLPKQFPLPYSNTDIKRSLSQIYKRLTLFNSDFPSCRLIDESARHRPETT